MATTTETKVDTKVKDQIEVIAKACSTLNKANAFKKARQLGEDIAANYFELGGVLDTIKKNGWYKQGDYSSLKDFAEGEFNISRRQVYYLVDLYDKILTSGVTWEEVAPIGWRKFLLVAGKISQDGVDKVALLETAAKLNYPDLEAYVKSMGDGTVGAEPKAAANGPTKKTFSFHEDQLETVEIAIDKSKEKNNTEFDSAAFEFICLNYLEGQTGKSAETPVEAKTVEVPFKPLSKQDWVSAFKDKATEADQVEAAFIEAFPKSGIFSTAAPVEIEAKFDPKKLTDKQVEAVIKARGMEGTLERFEKVFPNVDLTVAV